MIEIQLTESEVTTLKFYVKQSIIDAAGSHAIGIGSKTTVDNLKSILKKIGDKSNGK